MTTTKPPYADKVKEVTYEEAKLLRSLGVTVGADWKYADDHEWCTAGDWYMYSGARWDHVHDFCFGIDYELFFFIDKDDDCGQA